MIKVNCPRCGRENIIDISKAVDENGEVFRCEGCGYHFRYTNK